MPRFQSLPDIAAPIEGVRSPMLEEELSAAADALNSFVADFRMPKGFKGLELDQVYAIDGSDIEPLIRASDRLNAFLRSISPECEPWWIVLEVDRNSSQRKIRDKYQSLVRRAEAGPRPIVPRLDELRAAYDRAKREVF
jgi:hypothetical protein